MLSFRLHFDRSWTGQLLFLMLKMSSRLAVSETHTHTHTHLSLSHTAAHVDDIPPWFGPNAFSVGMMLVLAVGIVAIVGGVWFVQAQSKRKKHFF